MANTVRMDNMAKAAKKVGKANTRMECPQDNKRNSIVTMIATTEIRKIKSPKVTEKTTTMIVTTETETAIDIN